MKPLQDQFIVSHPQDKRFLQYEEGTPFIPNGLNLCFPRHVDPQDGERGLSLLKGMMDSLAAQGGNFVRFWLGHPFFDLETQKAGQYDTQRLARVQTLVAHARLRGLKVKLTFEHFRELMPTGQAERFAGVATFHKPLYHVQNGGPLSTMEDYLFTPAGHRLFLGKVEFWSRYFRDDPTILGWELWNEMNAVKGQGWEDWTELMLGEVKKLFPRHLVMQSLGSFDSPDCVGAYRRILALPGNEIAQVHRYHDPGAPWDICHGPLDVMLADAVGQMAAMAPGKPVLVAETGAVEARHSAPSHRYEQDTPGSLLQDSLFAPWMAGSVGTGQPWHWESYVDKNQLWWVFGAFSQFVEGIDPAKEAFVAHRFEEHGCRVYWLQGKSTTLGWLRAEVDGASVPSADWSLPGDFSLAGRRIEGRLLAPGAKFQALGGQGGKVRLPAFTQGLLLRMESLA